jgi:uncharacterized membrane protein
VIEEANAASEKIEDAGSAGSGARRLKLMIIGGLVVSGLGLFVMYLFPSTHKVISGQPVVAEPADYGPATVTMTPVSVAQDGDDLVFSLEELKQNRLVKFDYLGGKTPRSIMAYIAPDGRMVTAISLSEHCGSTDFEIRNNHIYCAHCPSHWDMMTMEAYACCGQYYPDPIPSRVDGGDVRIRKKDVEQWAGRL